MSGDRKVTKCPKCRHLSPRIVCPACDYVKTELLDGFPSDPREVKPEVVQEGGLKKLLRVFFG